MVWGNAVACFFLFHVDVNENLKAVKTFDYK